MARRTKRVFILGGGAALGAHHVGALRYLEEQGIRPDVIVASSIGVINACCYATGGVDALAATWSSIRSLPLIFAPSFRHNPLFGLSLFSSDRLVQEVERHVDFPKIFESRLPIEVILLNISRGRGELFTQRDCHDWREFRSIVRAGYSIPILFPPVRVRGDWYVDGGFAWNVPLDHALSLRPSEIYVLAPIASELPYKGRFRSFYDFSRRVADVMWRTIGNMGYIYAPIEDGMCAGVPITVIEPGEQWAGFGPLTVFQAYPRKNRILMDAGYRDAKRALARRQRAEGRKRPRASEAPPAQTEAEASKVITLGRSEPGGG